MTPINGELVSHRSHGAPTRPAIDPEAGPSRDAAADPADELEPGSPCVGLAARHRASVAAWVDGDPERALLLRRYFVERRPLGELGHDAPAALDQFIRVFGREHCPQGGSEVFLKNLARLSPGIFPAPATSAESGPPGSAPEAGPSRDAAERHDPRPECSDTTLGLYRTGQFYAVAGVYREHR